MKPQSFIFIGRYGAGKGTQSKLLIETLKKKDPSHSILYIETGEEFRKFFTENNSYTAQLSKKTIEAGDLMPEFMPIYIWSKLLVDHYTGMEHLVFDGTPRKPLEAQILDKAFPLYGIEKPWVVYLHTEHNESVKRLSLRAKESGRQDDGREALEERRSEYEDNVIPVVEYYRDNKNYRFLHIEGARSIEEIHTDIVKKLGLQ
jgi:adenylate kinase family enzyme